MITFLVLWLLVLLYRRIDSNSYWIPACAVLMYVTFGMDINSNCNIHQIIIDTLYTSTFVPIKSIFTQCNDLPNLINIIMITISGLVGIAILMTIIMKYLYSSNEIESFVERKFGPCAEEKSYFEKNNIKTFFTSFCLLNINIDKNEFIKDAIMTDDIMSASTEKFYNAIRLTIRLNETRNIGVRLFGNGTLQIVHCRNTNELSLAINKIISFLAKNNIFPNDFCYTIRSVNEHIYASYQLPYKISLPKLIEIVHENYAYISQKYNTNINLDHIPKNCDYYVKFKYNDGIIYIYKTHLSIMFKKTQNNDYKDIIEIHHNMKNICQEFERQIKLYEPNEATLRKIIDEFAQ